MPKLTTIKFRASGEATDKTPHLEIDLYYSVKGDSFYFRLEDIQEKVNKDITQQEYRGLFGGCKTREEAIKRMGQVIQPKGEISKHLRVFVKVGQSSHRDFCRNNEQTELSKDIIDSPSSFSYSQSSEKGMFITFERYISIKSQFGTFYCECFTHSKTGDNWRYNPCDFKTYPPKGMIAWSQDKEDFLVQTHQQLDIMSKNLMNFFNVEEKELENKMIPTNRLLESKSEE